MIIAGAATTGNGQITLFSTNAVYTFDRDQVIIYHVQDSILAYAQPMVPAPVESFGGKWIIDQLSNSHAHDTHTVLILHVTAR